MAMRLHSPPMATCMAGAGMISARIFIYRATNWLRVATGDNYSLGIQTDGSLWSWGRDDFGQLGIGCYDSTSSASEMPSMRPNSIRVGLETRWAAIAGGVFYSRGAQCLQAIQLTVVVISGGQGSHILSLMPFWIV